MFSHYVSVTPDLMKVKAKKLWHGVTSVVCLFVIHNTCKLLHPASSCQFLLLFA